MYRSAFQESGELHGIRLASVRLEEDFENDELLVFVNGEKFRFSDTFSGSGNYTVDEYYARIKREAIEMWKGKQIVAEILNPDSSTFAEEALPPPITQVVDPTSIPIRKLRKR